MLKTLAKIHKAFLGARRYASKPLENIKISAGKAYLSDGLITVSWPVPNDTPAGYYHCEDSIKAGRLIAGSDDYDPQPTTLDPKDSILAHVSFPISARLVKYMRSMCDSAHNRRTMSSLRNPSLRVHDNRVALVAGDGHRITALYSRPSDLPSGTELGRISEYVMQIIAKLGVSITEFQTDPRSFFHRVLCTENITVCHDGSHLSQAYPQVDKVMLPADATTAATFSPGVLSQVLAYFKPLVTDNNASMRLVGIDNSYLGLDMMDAGSNLSRQCILPWDCSNFRAMLGYADNLSGLSWPILDDILAAKDAAVSVYGTSSSHLRVLDQTIDEMHLRSWFMLSAFSDTERSEDDDKPIPSQEAMQRVLDCSNYIEPTAPKKAKTPAKKEPTKKAKPCAKKTEADLRRALESVDLASNCEDMLAQLTVLYLTVRDFLAEERA